jgi:hypothetical protein
MIASFDPYPWISVLKLLGGFAVLLAILYLFHWIAILVHELGHLCAGWLMGLYLVEVRIGDGPKLCTFRIGGIDWHFFAVPYAGWVAGFPKSANHYRIRQLIFILGGPLASLILAVSVFALTFPGAFGLGTSPEMNLVTWVLTYVAILEVVWSLWPRKVRLYGMETGSDGFLLWQLRYAAAPVNAIAVGLHWRASQALLSRRKEEAITLARQAVNLPNLPDRFSSEILLAYVLCESGEYTEAEGIYRRLTETVKEENRRFVEVVDSFASMTLYHNLSQLYPECESLLRRAIARWPEEKTLKGTLGSILIEQRRDEEGGMLIKELYELCTGPTDLGISAAYLSVLEAREGNHEQAAVYRNEARRHLPTHRLLDRLLGA